MFTFGQPPGSGPAAARAPRRSQDAPAPASASDFDVNKHPATAMHSLLLDRQQLDCTHRVAAMATTLRAARSALTLCSCSHGDADSVAVCGVASVLDAVRSFASTRVTASAHAPSYN
eukprot:COSAG05_NODE_2486_length_3002_cov_6.420510_1_plen_117_part_00